MLNKITIREWIRNFTSGKYDDSSKDTQWKAGWEYFKCNEVELSLRLRKIGYIISGITNNIILDYYTLLLYNKYDDNSSVYYDEIVFNPTSKDKYIFTKNYSFCISINKPKVDDEYLFDVSVSWNEFRNEFCCNDINMLNLCIDAMINKLYAVPMTLCNK